MADKSYCTICGRELGFWDSDCIRCGETTQMLCSVCMKLIQDADHIKMLSLLEQMKKSEHLSEPEKFGAYLEFRRNQTAEMSQKYSCCGQPMGFVGVQEFQQGSMSFLTGNLGNMLAGSMQLAIFRCAVCGQYRFYDPQYVSLLAGANKTCPQCGKTYSGHLQSCPDCGSEAEPQRSITCPQCGHIHNFYDLTCPECGYKYTGNEGKEPSGEEARRERELEQQGLEQEKKEKRGWFSRKKEEKPKWEL